MIKCFIQKHDSIYKVGLIMIFRYANYFDSSLLFLINESIILGREHYISQTTSYLFLLLAIPAPNHNLSFLKTQKRF